MLAIIDGVSINGSPEEIFKLIEISRKKREENWLESKKQNIKDHWEIFKLKRIGL